MSFLMVEIAEHRMNGQLFELDPASPIWKNSEPLEISFLEKSIIGMFWGKFYFYVGGGGGRINLENFFIISHL